MIACVHIMVSARASVYIMIVHVLSLALLSSSCNDAPDAIREPKTISVVAQLSSAQFQLHAEPHLVASILAAVKLAHANLGQLDSMEHIELMESVRAGVATVKDPTRILIIYMTYI